MAGSWKFWFGEIGPGTVTTMLPLATPTDGVAPMFDHPLIDGEPCNVEFGGIGMRTCMSWMLLSVAPLPRSEDSFWTGVTSEMPNTSFWNTVAGALAVIGWFRVLVCVPMTGTFDV